jgi:hypothetical protein
LRTLPFVVARLVVIRPVGEIIATRKDREAIVHRCPGVPKDAGDLVIRS